MSIKNISIIKKAKKLRGEKDRYLISLVAVFIIGYTIFFTSKLWMPPDKASIPATEIGTIVEANERRVTLISWNYDDEKRLMEVTIEITNTALDGIERYGWSAIEINKGRLIVEPVIEEDSFVVLRITGVPKKYEEISLRMRIDDETGEEELADIKLYATKDSVTIDDIGGKLSSKEYKKKACLSKADIYSENIEELEDLIKEEKELIREAEKTIKNLEERKTQQAPSEVIETERSIAEIQNKMQNSQSSISQYESEIAELKEKIEMQMEVYNSL